MAFPSAFLVESAIVDCFFARCFHLHPEPATGEQRVALLVREGAEKVKAEVKLMWYGYDLGNAREYVRRE